MHRASTNGAYNEKIIYLHSKNKTKMNNCLFFRRLSIFLLSLSVAGGLRAQVTSPYQPTRAEVLERYRKAKALDSLAPRSIFKASVQAHWINGGTAFWYRNFLKDSAQEIIYVDIAGGSRKKIEKVTLDSLRRTAYATGDG